MDSKYVFDFFFFFCSFISMLAALGLYSDLVFGNLSNILKCGVYENTYGMRT